MIRNFFKVVFRNIIHGKGISVINIGGLAIGMTSAMLILLFVQNELSYDRFYDFSARLYQSWNRDRGNNGINCWNVTPKPLGPALKKDFPEIEKATRVDWDQSILFTVGDKKINLNGNMVDPDFLTMFRFPLIKGDINTALNNPTDIMITEKTAKIFFGNENPIGKAIRIDNKYEQKVTAVMKDPPNNTQFDFEYLLPWTCPRNDKSHDSSWGDNSTRNFVLLKPYTDVAKLNSKIREIIIKHGEAGTTTQSFLYPVSRLRLYSNFENGVPAGGKIDKIRVFAIIAVLILLIACINFMNMSTARSEKRAKEVGIRKVVGAQKNSLIMQFLGESILLSFIAGICSLVIVQLCLPAFNHLIRKQLTIEYGNIYFWLYFICFILFTGIVSGSYPAFYLAAFRPFAILKGSFKRTSALITPRKVLVVVQFTFAIILIVCTIIIEKQIKYAQEREAGYNRNNLVWSFLSGNLANKYEVIKNELIGRGIAYSVTRTSAPLTAGWSSGGADWQGKNPNDRTEFNYFDCDGNLVKTAGLTVLMGRDIDIKIFPTDSNAVVINEAAAKVMGFNNPTGQIINRGAWDTEWHVIGVVKDFILQSPYEKIKPMIIQGPKANWFNLMHIKFNEAHSTLQNLAAMEKLFKEYNPEYPFEYHFINEDYAKKFSDEQTTGTLATLFAGLTIFISCLGLFGLTSYMAENRIKEIGVRKVLGASVASITALLSKDFVKLVFISLAIASPIAWWSMNKWLAGYNYHIEISWWIFFVAGLIAIIIALATVSFQAIKAAMANPATSLRSE